MFRGCYSKATILNSNLFFLLYFYIQAGDGIYNMSSAVHVAITNHLIVLKESSEPFPDFPNKIEATVIKVIGIFHHDKKIEEADESTVSADAGANKPTMRRHYASAEAIRAAAETLIKIFDHEAKRISHEKYGLSTFFNGMFGLNGAPSAEISRLTDALPHRIRDTIEAFEKHFEHLGDHSAFEHSIEFP